MVIEIKSPLGNKEKISEVILTIFVILVIFILLYCFYITPELSHKQERIIKDSYRYERKLHLWLWYM